MGGDILHGGSDTRDSTDASLLSYQSAWQANTYYSKNDTVTYAGSLYAAKSSFTSGASFNASNWDLLSAASGTELQCTEILTNPGQMMTGSGDTTFRDLAGWTLPALVAQPRPYLLRLVLNHFQIGSATTSVNWQLVSNTTAVGTAAVDGTNCWLDRNLFHAAAFAIGHWVLERRIPAGVALPALKARYKANNNVNNSAAFVAVGGEPGELVFARIEQISR